MISPGTEGSPFRIARDVDAEAIARVHDRSIRAAYRKIIPVTVLDTMQLAERTARWREWIADSGIDVLLRELEDEVVGFVSLCPSRDDDANPVWSGEIPTLYVDPAHWRARYGSDLLHAALGLARGRGFGEVTLWVLEKNQLARRFYEAHGFQRDGAAKPDPSLPEPALTAVRYRKSL